MDVDASSPPTKLPAPLHVVICPWLAFGHLLPYLELADRLASRGHRVSFVSTPRNLARLPEAHPLVDLVALPFPRVDGLPEGAESTNDVPGDKRELHWKAFDGLAVPFAEFMAAACASEDRKPHWVIGDCYHHWAAAAAVEHKSAKLLQQISQSEVLMLCGDTSILIWRYFLLNDEGKKTEEQTGTVRTNCIDCLDRTNVTQSMVGRKILESQLQRLGVLGANDTISNYPAFDADYKVLWANHGDAISTQYSGTPALKGDFVRYGKRTTQGILNDLWNALARYYLNNFADGTKQDAMDLLQGHYVSSVSRDITVPGKPGALESFRVAFALVLGAAMFMMISLRQARNDLRHLLVALVWAGLCIGITQYVKKNGRKFCNRPRFFLSRH